MRQASASYTGNRIKTGKDHLVVAFSSEASVQFRSNHNCTRLTTSITLCRCSGRALYAYRNHDRTGTDLHYIYFRISVSYSNDEGKTFKYLSTVEEHVPNGFSGLWEPYLRLARDGTLQCYYSAENSESEQDNFMKYSKDGGQTWSHWVTVSGGDRLSRDGMVGVAPIENSGNLM